MPGAVKRCCWGLCPSDSRLPQRLPEGTVFIPFPKPGRLRNNMTELEKRFVSKKTEKAERWQYLCGRSDFQNLDQIGENTHICSLHFAGGKGPDDEPVLSTPLVKRVSKEKATSTCETPGKLEKKRCMKTKRDEERMAKQKLENMISGNNFDITDLQVQHVHLLKAFGEMQTEAAKLRAENEKFQDALQSDFSKLSYRFLKCDEEQLRFLTGLHSVTFDWIVPKISRIIFRVHPEVNHQDHLLILLMKLKLGLCDDDLGYRFHIHGGIITAMCQTWIPALAAVLSPLVAWPSQDAIVKTNPSVFTGGVRRCCCIVDTFEVTIATPNATTKVASYLIGATPAGAITFVSLGSFSRKKSDRQLIRESGFVDLLKPMDLLLTNKTLPIQKDLDAIGATLLTPDVAKGKKPASTKEMDFPVAVWSHVEKVTDWWKDFGVFLTAIPADYEEMLDDLVVTCAALTNLQMSLSPKVKEH